jgi:hypothetical protein
MSFNRARDDDDDDDDDDDSTAPFLLHQCTLWPVELGLQHLPSCCPAPLLSMMVAAPVAACHDTACCTMCGMQHTIIA